MCIRDSHYGLYRGQKRVDVQQKRNQVHGGKTALFYEQYAENHGYDIHKSGRKQRPTVENAHYLIGLAFYFHKFVVVTDVYKRQI